MVMTIDNANKLLSVITSTITEDDDCFTIEDENLQVFKETLLTAIETMHKYQKIQEIMKSKKMDALNIGLLIPKDMACVLHEIQEVVEDGNK